MGCRRRSGRSDRTPVLTARQPLPHRIAAPVSLLDSALVRLLPAVPKPVVQLFSSRYIAGRRWPRPSSALRGAEQRREDGHRRRPRRGDHARGGDTRDRPGVRRRVRRDRRAASTPTSASSSPRSGSSCRTSSAARTSSRSCAPRPATASSCASTWRTRPSPTRRSGSSASCARRARQGRRRAPGAAAAHARRRAALAACGRTSASARASTSSRRRSRSPTSRRCARTTSARLEELLDAGCYVGIATHDEWLIGESLARIVASAGSPLEYELQMLLGVRELRRASSSRTDTGFASTSPSASVVRIFDAAAAGEPRDGGDDREGDCRARPPVGAR